MLFWILFWSSYFAREKHWVWVSRAHTLQTGYPVTGKSTELWRRPFNGLWSGTTRVGRYQKEHSPTHTHPDHRASFIIFLHLQWSMASSLFNLRAWQSSRTTSFQVFFGLPLGLEPSTSCSIHVAKLPCEIWILESWLQSEICIVIDKSQGSTAKHFSCDSLLRYKFIIQFPGERIFKISGHWRSCRQNG